MVNYIIVVGDPREITSRQYKKAQFELLRRGVKTKVLRINSSDWFVSETILDLVVLTGRANLEQRLEGMKIANGISITAEDLRGVDFDSKDENQIGSIVKSVVKRLLVNDDVNVSGIVYSHTVWCRDNHGSLGHYILELQEEIERPGASEYIVRPLGNVEQC